PAFSADLAGHRGHLLSEHRQGGGHAVDGVGELGDLALGLEGKLAAQVPIGHRGDHARDAAHLVGEVAGHGVDVVGQVFPDPRHALHVGLAAELAVGADLARDARHLLGKRVELVDHGVDGLLELQDLAADVDSDLLREVALLDGGGDLGDVADLAGQVAGHEVDVVGQVFPDPGDAFDLGLATQASLGAHLARDARDLVGEGVELVDHGVDGLLELEDLAADVDGDLLREVAVGDTGRDLGDVADLAGQVAGHQVHVVREVFPYATHAADMGLAAELALGADLTRDARHLAGERVELPDHGVDSLGGAQELALKRPAVDLQRHGLRQIAVGDGTDNA